MTKLDRPKVETIEGIVALSNVETIIKRDNENPIIITPYYAAYSDGYIDGGEDATYKKGKQRPVPKKHRGNADFWTLGWLDGSEGKFLGYRMPKTKKGGVLI